VTLEQLELQLHRLVRWLVALLVLAVVYPGVLGGG
jgi:hypothetical protein